MLAAKWERLDLLPRAVSLMLRREKTELLRYQQLYTMLRWLGRHPDYELVLAWWEFYIYRLWPDDESVRKPSLLDHLLL